MEGFLRRVIEGTSYAKEKICTRGRFSPQLSTTNPPSLTYEPAKWPYQDIHALHPSPATLPPFPCAETIRQYERCDFACQRRLADRISSDNQKPQNRSPCTSCYSHNKIRGRNQPTALKMMRPTRLYKHALLPTRRGWQARKPHSSCKYSPPPSPTPSNPGPTPNSTPPKQSWASPWESCRARPNPTPAQQDALPNPRLSTWTQERLTQAAMIKLS